MVFQVIFDKIRKTLADNYRKLPSNITEVFLRIWENWTREECMKIKFW